jgi:hypothetical protein
VKALAPPWQITLVRGDTIYNVFEALSWRCDLLNLCQLIRELVWARERCARQLMYDQCAVLVAVLTEPVQACRGRAYLSQ